MEGKWKRETENERDRRSKLRSKGKISEASGGSNRNNPLFQPITEIRRKGAYT